MHIALFAIAAALLLAAPSVQEAIRSLVPLPYVARLATNGVALVAAFNLVVTVTCVTAGPDCVAMPRRKRRLAIALLVTVALMTTGMASSEASFDSTAEMDLEYAFAQVTYWGFLGVCAARLILLMSRYLTRQDVRPRMRWAMLLVVTAAVVGMIWLTLNVIGVALFLVSHQGRGNLAAICDVLAATIAVLVATGVTLPVAAARSRRIIRRQRTGCLLRAITPMWRELTTTVPTVLLRQRDVLDDSSITLYRRVIEIRDAELILMKYAPSGIDDLVASAHPRRRARRVAVRSEAVALSLALVRYRAAAQPFARSATADYPSVNTSDLLREARWLVRVHRAMRTDEIVTHVRQLAAPPCECSGS